MLLNAANLKFDRNNDKSISTVVFKVLMAQYGDAVREEARASSILMAAKNANDKFVKEEEFGGGFGSALPYSDGTLTQMEQNVTYAHENTLDAEALMSFWNRKFLTPE